MSQLPHSLETFFGKPVFVKHKTNDEVIGVLRRYANKIVVFDKLGCEITEAKSIPSVVESFAYTSKQIDDEDKFWLSFEAINFPEYLYLKEVLAIKKRESHHNKPTT